MHARKPKKSNPVKNLAKVASSVVKRHGNVLEVMRDIIKLPKDIHGNVLVGVDNAGFDIWNNFLRKVVPFKIFGPTFIMTDANAIQAVLGRLKSEEGGFNGNASAQLMGKLTSFDTTFTAKDAGSHALHKSFFKNFISDPALNAAKVHPFVYRWLAGLMDGERRVNDQNLTELCSQMMILFLLSPASISPYIIDAVIKMKTHFINLSGLKELNAKEKRYVHARDTIHGVIRQLYHDNDRSTFAGYLRQKGQTLESVTDEISSLLMVGFDNFRSGLISMMVNLSTHPELHEALRQEVITIGSGFSGVSFLVLGPYLVKGHQQGKLPERFFKESTRQVPPVWVLARKNGEHPISIDYINAQGAQCTLTLPPRAMVLVPNHALLQQCQDGNEFKLDRDYASTVPFSIGPNSCPGRNIPYAVLGVLAALIVNARIVMTPMSATRFSPKVALTQEGVDIALSRRPIVQQQPKVTTFYNQLWAPNLNRDLIAVTGAKLAACAALYLLDSARAAIMAGALTATLLVHFLSAQEVAPEPVNALNRRFA